MLHNKNNVLIGPIFPPCSLKKFWSHKVSLIVRGRILDNHTKVVHVGCFMRIVPFCLCHMHRIEANAGENYVMTRIP